MKNLMAPNIPWPSFFSQRWPRLRSGLRPGDQSNRGAMRSRTPRRTSQSGTAK